MGYPTITTDHYRNICHLIYHSHKYIIIYPDQFDHCPPLNYPPQHRRAHLTPLPNPPPGAVRKRRKGRIVAPSSGQLGTHSYACTFSWIMSVTIITRNLLQFAIENDPWVDLPI